ncbi:hypothetical protein GGX14DRAFT_595933 [Mycena pura]|uniref:Uncharacterized protein n=1 Tax=Mycena pura TaxID=153505 RepID=A0AAD6UQ65_9AGAR|nr:hypothetical protein GGX14DRAFT_595933 [Mycena pura]
MLGTFSRVLFLIAFAGQFVSSAPASTLVTIPYPFPTPIPFTVKNLGVDSEGRTTYAGTRAGGAIATLVVGSDFVAATAAGNGFECSVVDGNSSCIGADLFLNPVRGSQLYGPCWYIWNGKPTTSAVEGIPGAVPKSAQTAQSGDPCDMLSLVLLAMAILIATSPSPGVAPPGDAEDEKFLGGDWVARAVWDLYQSIEQWPKRRLTVDRRKKKALSLMDGDLYDFDLVKQALDNIVPKPVVERVDVAWESPLGAKVAKVAAPWRKWIRRRLVPAMTLDCAAGVEAGELHRSLKFKGYLLGQIHTHDGNPSSRREVPDHAIRSCS